MATSSRAESFVLTVGDDAPHPIEIEGTGDWAGWSAGAGVSISIHPSYEDTSGQSFEHRPVVDVLVQTGDTEAQAFSLRFPSPAEAAQFQKRLMVAGVLAGTLVAGTVALEATRPGATSTASQTGQAQAAQVVPLPAPAVPPGLRAERIGAGDAAEMTITVPAPRVAPGLRAEQVAAPQVTVPAPKVAPGLRAEEPSAPSIAATVPAPDVAPGLRAEDPTAPSETVTPRSGEFRGR
jgi:hypothetical protein